MTDSGTSQAGALSPSDDESFSHSVSTVALSPWQQHQQQQQQQQHKNNAVMWLPGGHLSPRGEYVNFSLSLVCR